MIAASASPPQRIIPSTVLLVLASAAVLFPSEGNCYIGPGAGFAFVGSFFVMISAVAVAAGVLLMWPVRVLVYNLRRKKGYKDTGVGRVVVVGLDGLDPDLTRKWAAEGSLPNLKRLMDEGTFMPLETTCPSISPVAWSSFSTGVTPARHGIFDFLDRDLNSYLPVLSSARIGGPKRTLKLGRFKIPLGGASVKLLRKGTPFWHYLGEKGISCSVLRVPITFPPEKYEGRLLSAMCVPDLKGSQGTFSLYTSDPAESARREGGEVHLVEVKDGKAKTFIYGPENPFIEGAPASKVPVKVKIDRAKGEVVLVLPDERLVLKPGEYSGWVRLSFPLAPGVKAKGICRFLAASLEPFRLYATPVNIDPDSPSLPVSHPKNYAVYLAKKLGSYATLGLAEDTWALNEKAIGEKEFLEQCYGIHAEREAMLMNELENVRKGLVVCVFDITDRIQHMFWRYTDPEHPANAALGDQGHGGEIRALYERMDAMVGRVTGKLGKDDMLVIMSDHGFTSFRRGVNLNTWLYENGYLSLEGGEKPSGDEWFHGVDWTRTRAYGVGLGGICLNIKGRERQGIVQPGAEADALKAEIKEKLSGLMDSGKGARAVKDVYDLKALYKGPYLEGGPELVAGFERGYRVSWDCAKGAVSGSVFSDNVKSWSGDHCVDFSSIPGVFFCNRKMGAKSARIIDIGPTVLHAFGLEVPRQMEGRPLV